MENVLPKSTILWANNRMILKDILPEELSGMRQADYKFKQGIQRPTAENQEQSIGQHEVAMPDLSNSD